MTIYSNYLVFPDGEVQETENRLTVNQYVDLNGFPVRLPLPSRRTIVYRVYRVRRSEERGEEATHYYLELVIGNELIELTGR